MMKTEEQKAAHRAAATKWRLANKEAQKALCDKWRAENKERRLEYNKEYRKRNPEMYREASKRYNKKNPAFIVELVRRRNGLKARAIPSWYEEEEVNELYLQCAALNEKLNLSGKDALAVDHIIPLTSKTVCGLHCLANLQLLSKSENSSKGNKYQSDW